MITSAGWNAFLKTIEEPPKYTIFIFCTTEPTKIPETILNRVQRYNLTKISAKGIYNRLMFISQQEGYTNYEQTCDFIAKASQGGMRDAISYLEQIADYSTDLNLDVAKKILGGLSYENMFKLTWALHECKESDILQLFEQLYSTGQDIKTFVNLYLDFILDLIKYILFHSIEITAIPAYLATEENPVVQYTTNIPEALQYFNKLADRVLQIKAAIKSDANSKATVEIMLINFLESIK